MASDWTELPKHLLDLILEKIDSSLDYLNFSITCIKWYSIIKDNQIKHITKFQDDHVPLLLIPREEEEHIWDIYNVMDKKLCKSQVTVPYSYRFGESSKGWLIAVNEDFTVSLYKPFANENICIQLPVLFHPLEQYEQENVPENLYPNNEQEYEPEYVPENLYSDNEQEYNQEDVLEDIDSDDYESENSEIEEIQGPQFYFHIYKVIITTDPLEDPDNCIIMVIVGEFYELAFIRLTKDKTWTKIDTRGSAVDEILHYNNRFYATTNKGELGSFNITDSGILNEKLLARKPKGASMVTKKYIVKLCERDLLLVERYAKEVSRNGARLTYKFKVFKFEFNRHKWVQIKGLGDVALFLGDNTTIAVLASKFNGIQSNCIYFTHDDDRIGLFPGGLCDLGLYNMETRSCVFHFTMDSTIFTKMFIRPPIWVVPTINF